MRRALTTIFAAVAYLVFARSLIGFVLFLGNLSGGAQVSGPPTLPWKSALLVDVLLIGAFCIHHSALARRPLKAWLERWVEASTLRSVYVLVASLLLLALVEWWQPIGPVLWQLEGWALAVAHVLFGAGWLLAIVGSWQLDHQRLFGFRPTLQRMLRRDGEPAGLVTTGLYRHVRHPIYLGTLIALWATPTGTPGHLLLAVTLTAYVILGMHLEERDLSVEHGAGLTDWARRTPALVPRVWRRASSPKVERDA